MKINRLHIIFKIIAILLVFAIMAPTLIKYSHGFQDHKHEVCDGNESTHLHEIDVDCDFYKFKLSSSFYSPLLNFESNLQSVIKTLDLVYYNFLNTHNQNTFYLRGPPAIA